MAGGGGNDVHSTVVVSSSTTTSTTDHRHHRPRRRKQHHHQHHVVVSSTTTSIFFTPGFTFGFGGLDRSRTGHYKPTRSLCPESLDDPSSGPLLVVLVVRVGWPTQRTRTTRSDKTKAQKRVPTEIRFPKLQIYRQSQCFVASASQSLVKLMYSKHPKQAV